MRCEKKFSKHPEKFGKGAIEGVAAPEAANNAAAEGAFVTLFTFGIPPNVVMALLLGALMIHGITPGPLMIPQHPEIFWGRHCEHVRRQCDAPGTESAVDRSVGSSPESPLQSSFPLDLCCSA